MNMFGPSSFEPEFEIEEKRRRKRRVWKNKDREEIRRRKLETRNLGEYEEHTGISEAAFSELCKRLDRLDRLKSGNMRLRKNEEKILLAGIHNVVAQEVITQKYSSSITKEEIKQRLEVSRSVITKRLEDSYPQIRSRLGESFWAGIESTVEAVLEDIRHDNKDVFFSDELDASYAVDYILTGRALDENGEEIYVAEFVQVGSSSDLKDPTSIQEKHKDLVKKLHHNPKYQSSYEEVESQVIEILKEFKDVVKKEIPDNENTLDGAVSIMDEVAANKVDDEEWGSKEDWLRIQKARFLEDIYALKLLEEHLRQTEETLSEILSSVLQSNENEEVAEFFQQAVESLLTVLSDPELKKSIPLRVNSRITIMDKNNGRTDEVLENIDVDKDMTAVYYIDEAELLTRLKKE